MTVHFLRPCLSIFEDRPFPKTQRPLLNFKLYNEHGEVGQIKSDGLAKANGLSKITKKDFAKWTVVAVDSFQSAL